MTEKCKDCEDARVSVPFVMEHMSHNNRRMLIALLAVCIKFVIPIIVFTTGYTAREKNWLDTLQRVGVADGIQQQPNP